MILLTYVFRNHVRDANRRIRTAIARINGFLQEHISGMSIVQLFNREEKSRVEIRRIESRPHGSLQGRDRRIFLFLSRRRTVEHVVA